MLIKRYILTKPSKKEGSYLERKGTMVRKIDQILQRDRFYLFYKINIKLLLYKTYVHIPPNSV